MCLSEGGSEQQNLRIKRGLIDRFVESVTVDDDCKIMGEAKSQGKKVGLFVKEQRDVVNCEVARFFYSNAILFNVIETDSFHSMLRAIGNYGIGYKPPSRHELSMTLLKNEVEDVAKSTEDIKKTWKETGVSILSDGYTRGRQLINFVINNPCGNVFLKSVDASEMIKDANLIFKLLDEVVEEVGEDLVVQVVTDNASNYKKDGQLLMKKRKGLWWTPCTAHCTDLMLEYLGKLTRYRDTLTKAKKVTTFIYNHSWVLALLRQFAKKYLVRPAAIRFATGFLTIQRLMDLREQLEQMFTSPEWAGCSQAKKQDGQEVKEIILRYGYFWDNVIYVLNTTQPLVQVLRLADSEESPGMGFLYGAMDEAKEKIDAYLEDNYDAYGELWIIIDHRWEFQLHRDLHAAAYYLNPRFQ